MIINLGCASIDNHIPRDDIFDYILSRMLYLYTITSCYSDDEFCHSFAIAAGDSLKYQHGRETFNSNGEHEAWFSDFQLPITLLFVVRNIKCGTCFLS